MPEQCFGKVMLNITNTEGKTFLEDTLFLFNDLKKKQCETDTDCKICGCLCHDREFMCTFDNSVPCAVELQNSRCNCVNNQCVTSFENTPIQIINFEVFKNNISVGHVSSLGAH
jgi:hypothetical protein